MSIIPANLRWLLTAWMLTVGACVSVAVESDREPLHTHSLNPEWRSDSEMRNSDTGHSAVLLVTMPQAQPGNDTPRMVYLRRPHEVSYYATHQWVESPPHMLGPLLVQALERTGTWKSVIQAPTIVVGDYRLDSDQLALEQRFFEQPSRVRVSLRAQILDLRQYGVVATKWFEVFEAAPSEDAYGGVTAANRAAGRLLDDLAIWTSECMRHPESC